MTTLEAAAARIEDWLRARAPALRAALRGPVAAADLAALHAAVGDVPAELARWLGRHDGQDPAAFAVLGDHRPLGARAIAAVWRERCADVEPGAGGGSGDVGDGWYRRGWVPFADTGGGDLLVVDLDPGPTGRVGQIVDWRHDHHARDVVAASLGAWLAAFADALDAGLWTPHPIGMLLGPP